MSFISLKNHDDLKKVFSSEQEVNAAYSEQQPKRLRMQVMAYVACYLFWISVHAQRELWAMSKSSIKKADSVDFNIELFGTLDFVLFLSYAFAQFTIGSAGDNFNKKWVLAISFLVQAAVMAVLAMGGAAKVTSHSFYVGCFVILGYS